MLPQDTVAALTALTDAAAGADGEQPLNEDARLALTGNDADVRHFFEYAGDNLIGYAQANDRHGSAQLVVHPAHRRAGVGTRLLSQVPGHPIWAFGDGAAAQGFAAAHGMPEVRRLLVLSRPLDPPSGATFETVRRFDPATDTEQLLALNRLAFDWHPEQRHFSTADLAARMAEDWYDPDGFLVTTDAAGLTGFHWTKRHQPDGRGEVYILATHPRAQGTGVGRTLLAAGLEHLARRGSRTVHLYVDAANTRAVQLYERAGFAVVHSDVLYGPPHFPLEQS